MQLLEDKDIIDYGNMAERIIALREKVQQLLENRTASSSTSGEQAEQNEKLVAEILMLKKQLAEKKDDTSEDNTVLIAEIETLKNKLKESSSIANFDDSDVVQENLMLKKKLADREKTIKELDFKLEMFKLAKSLREGAGINTKSEELKKIINEYIKEIDSSIASLNIE